MQVRHSLGRRVPLVDAATLVHRGRKLWSSIVRRHGGSIAGVLTGSPPFGSCPLVDVAAPGGVTARRPTGGNRRLLDVLNV
jgi:hypothetical protein